MICSLNTPLNTFLGRPENTHLVKKFLIGKRILFNSVFWIANGAL